VNKHSGRDGRSCKSDEDTPADELEFGRFNVIFSLAYSIWCQRRLMEFIHSFRAFECSSASLALLAKRGRVAADAQAKCFTAFERFRSLVEQNAGGDAKWEH
jgi:hypothetical protein